MKVLTEALTEALPEGLAAASLVAADASAAVSLSAEAGWNQTAADWRLMIALGEATGVRDTGGRLVASALVLPFEGPFAWISMVLVTATHRRRGIATALMAHCMARLDALGLVPVLDATDAGRRVYAPLGFEPVHGLLRLRAERIVEAAAPRRDVPVRSVRAHDWPAVAALDRRAFGAGRAALLYHLGTRQPARAMVAADLAEVAAGLSGVATGPTGPAALPPGIAGFVLAREGREALQIGPVVAKDSATASALTAAALAGAGGPVCMDAIEGHAAYAEWLADAGFVVQRGFARMILGRGAPFGDPGLVYAAAGPELG